jgi:hypothetical protein
VKVKNRDPVAGLLEFFLRVDYATIPQAPLLCAEESPSTTKLETSFTFEDGFNPPVLVATERTWRCLGNKLATP